MTLAQRLLLYIAVLTILTTATLTLGVREAWRRTEEEHFRAQFAQAVEQLHREFSRLDAQLAHLALRCRHDPVVDSALVGLKSDDLDARRISISEGVPPMMKALLLDELVLSTSSGEVLGAGHDARLLGQTDATLSRRIAALERKQSPEVRPPGPREPMALHFGCIHRHEQRPHIWVGLYGAQHLEPVLSEISKSHQVELRMDQAELDPERMAKTVELSRLGGISVTATKSRTPLLRALSVLNWTIFAIGGATLAAAMLVAILMSRALSRPIVDLSRQAREVAGGEPKPVRGRGGRELEQLAESFNRAISDLAALRKRLASTERIAARREIARRVAHEIKNPLAPIRAAVETLRRLRARNDPAFDDYFEEATRTVLGEVARISNIVSEFTRFARLPPPNPRPIDFVEAIRSVVNLHAGAGIRITFQSEACPSVLADRDQVVQVATNLLQNAIDAAKNATLPRVWVTLLRQDDSVVLSVRDNGPGIAEQMRDRLFEPYATTKQEGTGLGLSIVERIVTEHGGEVRHRTPAEGGAEFFASFPILGPSLLPEPPPASMRDAED